MSFILLQGLVAIILAAVRFATTLGAGSVNGVLDNGFDGGISGQKVGLTPCRKIAGRRYFNAAPLQRVPATLESPAPASHGQNSASIVADWDEDHFNQHNKMVAARITRRARRTLHRRGVRRR